MELNLIVILVVTGIIVGVINTFAGAAAAVSIAIFTALGLPITVANGTNRIPVLAQTLVMSLSFARQKVLDYRLGLKLGAPTVVGSIIGSLFASRVDITVFTYMLSTVLVILLAVMLFNPAKFMKESVVQVSVYKIRFIDYVWFFLIGLYGGAIHIAVGYLILTITIMKMGFDIISANAMKGFIVLLYIPFALAIFMYNGQVMYTYGLVHAVGNIIGAFLASFYAKRINTRYIHWLLIFMLVVTILDLFKVINIKFFVHYLMSL